MDPESADVDSEPPSPESPRPDADVASEQRPPLSSRPSDGREPEPRLRGGEEAARGERTPTPAHILLARSLLAGLGAEVCAWLALLSVWRLSHGSFLPLTLGAYLVAFGLLTGVVFAVAEFVSERRGVWLGALLTLPLIPCVALGSRFALEALLTRSPIEAFAKVIVVESDTGWLQLLFASGALALYAPLLWIRRRGGSVFAQTYAMSAGALVWLALLVILPGELGFEVLNLTLYLLPIFARVLVFPLGLWVANLAVDPDSRRRRLARGGRRRGAEARMPGQRHKAKWLDEQARVKLAAGAPVEAAEALERALGEWPTGGRALEVARAWVRVDEPYKAIDALRVMLDEPRPGPKALSDPALAPLAGLEEFEELKTSALRDREPQRQPHGLDPRLTLHALLGCVGAVLLALAVMPIYHPDVPADVTRARLRGVLWTDAEELFATGERLDFGGQVRRAKGTEGLIGLSEAFVRLEVPSPLVQDRQAARAWYLRAAQAGHLEGMLRAAEGFDQEGDVASATRWFRLAAQGGQARAMWRYGAALRWGNGVQADVAQALTWYRRAAEAGDTDAMVNLAGWLEFGRGIERDIPQAARWLREARGRGSGLAAVELRSLLRRHPGAAGAAR